MIEVFFSDPAGGILKAAKDDLFPNENTNIIVLNFMLDLGFINNDITGEYRVSLPGKLYSIHQFDKTAGILQDYAESDWDVFGHRNNRQWEMFQNLVQTGEDIRIWISDRPNAMCGLLFLCTYLKEKQNRVFVLKSPFGVLNHTKECFLNSWDVFGPEEIKKHLSDTKKLSPDAVQTYAHRWEQLIAENTMLRAVLSGSVMSVEEDFYDFLIWKYVSKIPITQGKVMENICREGIPVDVLWFDYRIEKLIKQGKLLVTEGAEDSYKRKLKKT